jgi:hypothetical protein
VSAELHVTVLGASKLGKYEQKRHESCDLRMGWASSPR